MFTVAEAQPCVSRGFLEHLLVIGAGLRLSTGEHGSRHIHCRMDLVRVSFRCASYASSAHAVAHEDDLIVRIHHFNGMSPNVNRPNRDTECFATPDEFADCE